MYVTILKSAGSPSFNPPAYVGSRLTEAVGALLKITELPTAHFGAVYTIEEGKNYGISSAPIPLLAMSSDDEVTTFGWKDGNVPIELYKRGFPEIDKQYEAQNPRL